MKVYLLHLEWNYHGDTINDISAVYDNIKKAQKSLLESCLHNISYDEYKSMKFLDSECNEVSVSPNISLQRYLFWDDENFNFPVNRVELVNSEEAYCYITIEEKELL